MTNGYYHSAAYTYADTIEYNAARQTLKERLDMAICLYHRHAYNNRFQIIKTRLGASSTD